MRLFAPNTLKFKTADDALYLMNYFQLLTISFKNKSSFFSQHLSTVFLIVPIWLKLCYTEQYGNAQLKKKKAL